MSQENVELVKAGLAAWNFRSKTLRYQKRNPRRSEGF
jgi:hypothetical protein